MTDAERRRLRRWIDLATDHCERHNLAEEYAVPGWIYDLVVVFQDANHLPISPPQDTVEAHGQLLDLKQCYMPASREPEAGDLRASTVGPRGDRRRRATNRLDGAALTTRFIYLLHFDRPSGCQS